MSLESLISVNTHYTRSINLERDALSIDVVNAYIPTSRALRTFSKVIETFHEGQAPRAWSWIGPYGSGKSSASVFLGQLLTDPETDSAKAALKNLSRSDKAIADKFKRSLKGTEGCLKVFLTGAPEPMARRLVRAIAHSAEQHWKGRRGSSPKVVDDLAALATSKDISVSEVLEALSTLQTALSKTNCAGLVIVIDELGKFLEYEARHYGANDIYLLQALAEHACKGRDVNLMLFVLLHQSFEQYAKGLGESLKNEWSKVQGRFEEVPFLESAEQVLRVVSAAFENSFDSVVSHHIEKSVARTVSVLDKQQALPGTMSQEDATALFLSCYPLHPVSALLLPALCQKIAQNERTLFSYLGSHEEFGLQDMLARLCEVGEFIYPHHLYDYFITNQSSAMGDYLTHRRWAEVVTALERLGNTEESDVNLLKTIGILNIVGSKGGFKPSKAVLELCCKRRGDFQASVSTLENQSVITYRRYSGEYRVWQGSDFDLEEAVQNELNNLGAFSLVDELNSANVMLPVVARRYTVESGTLRYFQPLFIDAASYKKLEQQAEEPRILFYLASGQDDEKIFREEVCAYFSHLDIVSLCLSAAQLRDAVMETQALRRVGVGCQQLNSDPIAKREYEDRLTAAELAEDKLLLALMDSPQDNEWFCQCELLQVGNKRQLQEALSNQLEVVYADSPIVHNELINRDKPSAQAVSARNKLLYAMLHHSGEADLGIKKFPPEKAMYRSLLRATGLHIENPDGTWGFSVPSTDGRKDRRANMRHVWRKIEDFLDSTEQQEKSFVDLSETLTSPPYGVKAGILPVLYLTAYLLHQHEIAIYENRRYRAYFTQEMLERFVKRPDEFTVQRFRIQGLRASIFEQYSQALSYKGDSPSLLDIARPLASFMGALPEYTQKTKRGLSQEAIRVRGAFNLAKSPERLLFESLPVALNYEPVTDATQVVQLEGFSAVLTNVLRELRDAYGRLLDKQCELLANAFNLDASLPLADLRKVITGYCHGLESYTVDTEGLRAFIMRLNKLAGSDEAWLENVLMFLGHKPTKKWLDSDHDTAEYRLADFSRRVIDLEKLRIHARDRATTLKGDFDVYLLRSIRKGGEIFDDVVAIDVKSAKRVHDSVEEIHRVLDGLQDKELMLAALAQAVNQFMEESQEPKKGNDMKPKLVGRDDG